ncbi:protein DETOXIFICATION 30-like isoform X2 [Andrographis paniculata]|uniref:protein DETOXIFICATION 30-like isoform X2 n=1 Tax=Andrographis paniculata TaxID=175694 RepID=UPI0021E771A3|nr:protein DETOXIFICATION 30-like isoform X2 [Andrographis paniculata]
MEDDVFSFRQPLLPPELDGEDQKNFPKLSSVVLQSSNHEGDDIPPISGLRSLCKELTRESKKLWYLAGPAIFTSISQYSLGAITQTFAGHVGDVELAAFSIENSVIAGLSLGVTLGMGSALETLCGQAYGAGEAEMLGVYLQRSWVILLSTASLLTSLYVFATPFLLLIGQEEEISRLAGKFSVWMIPQLYAYALNFPIAKFLQAQSRIAVMAWISASALVIHAVLSWIVMLRLGMGMAGGAVVLNASWWYIVVAQLVYIWTGRCGPAWTGFSSRAFQNLRDFVRLSLASAVMLCANILGWTLMVAIGFNAAISVRVSNELGAIHPRTAKFSVLVVVMTSFVTGLIIAGFLLIFRRQYPSLFTDSPEVKKVVDTLTPLLAFSIVINNVQPALSGVAIGAGWQALVAYVNVACYYLFGIPLGLIMGFTLKMDVSGIWYGMLAGTMLQTLILFWIVYRTNWDTEASAAALRIKVWGGDLHVQSNTIG